MQAQEEDILRVGEYEIPTRLVRLTGCPLEQFEPYGNAQFQTFQQYLHISEEESVLEIGCGIGRLAIPATRVIGPAGRYLGIEIIPESVSWCRENITRRFPNFSFHFENVKSPLHNPAGSEDPAKTVIPLADSSVDKLFLSSVFTHMFPAGLDHYLKEFRRVLKPGGIALATAFLLNTGSREAITKGKTGWSFSHPYVDEAGQCWIEFPQSPEGAVAYDESAFLQLLRRNRLQLLQPVVYGAWAGLGGALADGQDYAIFGLEGR
jgi:SAM-dependent methyltransferase